MWSIIGGEGICLDIPRFWHWPFCAKFTLIQEIMTSEAGLLVYCLLDSPTLLEEWLELNKDYFFADFHWQIVQVILLKIPGLHVSTFHDLPCTSSSILVEHKFYISKQQQQQQKKKSFSLNLSSHSHKTIGNQMTYIFLI